MKNLIALLSLLLVIGGCASYSPEQLEAKASDKSDFDLCFDMVVPNPSQYSKQELMNREVNCSDPKIAEPVLEKRRKQIALGQALMAFGNSIKSNSPSITPSLNTLPNYSNNNTAKTGLIYFLSTNYVSGLNRICIYKNGGMTATHTMSGIGMCPMTKNF
ncbi:hypothetical protein N9E05_06220 [Gammaproteobacteria bacterium]|nr:hypothetical protein [Gammaproteobacteria bacterium]